MAKTILLADDSITIQKIVNLTFSGEGIEVVTVGNGDAAIKKVHEIDPDLVLADIFMPGKNGYEVCEYIKGQSEVQRTPVILLVGAFEPFDSNEAARVKADGHLTKPFEIKVLISAVNSLISAAEEQEIEASLETDMGLNVETLPDTIAVDSSAEIEVGAPVVVHRAVVSESAGSELQPALASSTITSAFFAGELLAPEGPVVDVGEDAKQDTELEASERVPVIVPEGEQTPMRASFIGLEDLDPLGLYASEPITTFGPEKTATAPSDSKELVVDIWEPRSSSPGQIELLPEAAMHGPQVPAGSPTVTVQEPAHVECAVKAGSPTPINLAGRNVAVFTPPESSALSSPLPFERGSIALTENRMQQKKPAVSTQADSAELVDIIVQRVMEKLSREVIEKVAWEVVPDLAEIIIKEQVETHFKASGRV
jgi:CheY-like chemotaxis protein